jgi:tetratricopeptide (TPR) repeat protein
VERGEQAQTLELARHYLEVERPERALEALERGPVDLEDPETWEVRAEALLDSRKYVEAARAAREGLTREPDDLSLLETLALAELGLARYDEADRTILRALELWPDNPLLVAQRAMILARATRFREAQKLADDAVRGAPDSTHVLRVRAQVDALSEDRLRTKRSVEALLAVEPADPMGLALAGALASEDKRYGDAARHLSEAARLVPDDADIAAAARETRIAAHPLLAPVRPLLRFGRFRSWLVYLLLIGVLAAARLQTLRIVVVIVWLTIAALSWFAPPILRWRQRRRYGR